MSVSPFPGILALNMDVKVMVTRDYCLLQFSYIKAQQGCMAVFRGSTYSSLVSAMHGQIGKIVIRT